MFVHMAQPESRIGWWAQAVMLPTTVAALVAVPIWYNAFVPPDVPAWIPITAIVLGCAAALGIQCAVVAPSVLSNAPDDWPTWKAMTVFMVVLLAIPASGTIAGVSGINLAFQERGGIAGCEIEKVDERVEYRTVRDNNGNLRTETVTAYDHALDCEVETITELTTDAALGEKGDHVEVEYDASNRLDPRPAEERWNWTTLLWISIVTLIVGMVARASVLRLERE